MLDVVITKQARLFLQKIPAKHAAQIVSKIDALRADPAAIPSIQLEGYPQFRRVKSGEYRIIYRIEQGALVLCVLRIGKRNDSEVYRHLDTIGGG